jgi:hypothetical protein
MELYTLVKDLQENTLIGVGPQGGYLSGFQPASSDTEALTDPGFASIWTGYSASARTALTTQYVQAWINQLSTYTPAQMYAGKDGSGRPWASPTEDCSTDPANVFGGQMWASLPRLRAVGVAAPLMNQVYTWFAAVFPATNWAANKTQVCTPNLSQCK